jgi:hypothetical protein
LQRVQFKEKKERKKKEKKKEKNKNKKIGRDLKELGIGKLPVVR